jgi:hypothetical protein
MYRNCLLHVKTWMCAQCTFYVRKVMVLKNVIGAQELHSMYISITCNIHSNYV